jgi:hypothetical protein
MGISSAIILPNWAFRLHLAGQEGAAWLQAIASVVTIAVGAIAIRWQVKHAATEQARIRHEDDVRKVVLLWMLAYECRVELKYMSELPSASREDAERLRSKVLALEAVRVFEIPSPLAAAALFAMIDGYKNLTSFFQTLATTPTERLKLVRAHLPAHINAALLNFEFGEQRLRLALVEYSAWPVEHLYSINGVEYPPLAV